VNYCLLVAGIEYIKTESVAVSGCSERTERDPSSLVLDTVFITVMTLRKKDTLLMKFQFTERQRIS
jgi:hypothetical protein